ncbi:hypothetical protein [uncultured Agitococcus sp.]|uniref:hypothetical protein n=1 Tax=uncultured Agitococcus sp. TaxID=1506599 RepID=UPI0026357059|nr:hypothetical protein [uncultured Agitococcus sp.]
MAFQIDPNIPLRAMANPINIGESFSRAQTYQANDLKLQALREQFNEEKEARLRQKQMQQGIASELQKMQQGTPAQYRTTFPQTIPTGQMPQGMTGVLAAERGQNLPTPDLFGENILKGNFDVRREMIAPEVKGVTPDYLDVLNVSAKNALQVGDIDSFIKFSNAIKQERAAKAELDQPVGNPYEMFKDGQSLGMFVTTKGNKTVPYGQAGATMTKPDKLTAAQEREYAFKEKKLKQDAYFKERELNKPVYDPVERVGAVADVKAEAKIRQDLVADAAGATKTYANIMPILRKAKNILSRLPPDAWQSYYQSKIAGTPLSKYIGNKDQQDALAELDVLQENLRLKAEKPAGAISNFEMGLLSKAMGVLKENTSPSQKTTAFQQIISILENDKTVALNILKQNNASNFAYKGGEFLNRFTNKASSEQRKEYLDAYMQVKNDPELLKELQENARDLGVLE